MKHNDDYAAWTMVREFQLKQGHVLPGGPANLTPKMRLLRQRLILEELGELSVAIHENNLVEIADACCDLAYVLHGTAVAMGMKTESYFYEMTTYPQDPLAAVADDCAVVVRLCGSSDDWVLGKINLAVFEVARTMAAYHLPFEKCFREVHRSNMTKTAIATADAVKYLGNPKGDGYEPPQLKAIIDLVRV